MGNVSGFPSVQERAVRSVQFQHSAGKFLAGFLIHLAEMHHSLGVCNILQIHVGFVHFHCNGFLHGDVAGSGFQFSYLVVAVRRFKGELAVGVCFAGSKGVFSSKVGGLSRKQPKGNALQRSLLCPGFMSGDLASEQLVVELNSCGLISCYGDCLPGGNFISGGEIALLLRHGVLTGDQVLNVDLSSSVRSEDF